MTVESVGEFTLKGIRHPLAAYNVLTSKLPIEAANAYRGMRSLRTPLDNRGAEAPSQKQQGNGGKSRFGQ